MFTARFIVHSVNTFSGEMAEVVMMADTNTKSDYAKFTPSGELRFQCTNPKVLNQCQPGKAFTLTFQED